MQSSMPSLGDRKRDADMGILRADDDSVIREGKVSVSRQGLLHHSGDQNSLSPFATSCDLAKPWNSPVVPPSPENLTLRPYKLSQT